MGRGLFTRKEGVQSWGEAASSRMGKGKREKQEDCTLSRTELEARAPSKVDMEKTSLRGERKQTWH